MSLLPSVRSLANIFQSNSSRQKFLLLKQPLISSPVQQKSKFRSTRNPNNTQNNSRRPESSRPELWYTSYPISLIGKRQSPINIKTNECILNSRDVQLKPLIIDYPQHFNDLILKNPRDDKFWGWRVDVFSKYANIRGGPLDHTYRLAQFHCHWGKTCSCGSEHTIDGNHYSAELHFVHWNSDVYSTPMEALHSPNGLSVIAVFLQSCDQPNEELSKVTEKMSKIKYKGDRYIFKDSLDLFGLLPKEKAYWTYSGSLTTPPLWETVTWIVFKQPILCTEQQIQSFRQLSYKLRSEVKSNDENDSDFNIEENFRSQQPLNERPIIFVKEKQKTNLSFN